MCSWGLVNILRTEARPRESPFITDTSDPRGNPSPHTHYMARKYKYWKAKTKIKKKDFKNPLVSVVF